MQQEAALRSIPQKLSGWGGVNAAECRVQRPESQSALRRALKVATEYNLIARGLGRSYGDSAVNRDGGVIVQTRLNRFLAFDAESGVLTCESGVSLAEIIDCFLPRGWFLPTTPGTKHVTIGGAIAADVHGKNHHVDGTLGNFVLDLQLLTAAGNVLTCSRSENPELFWATIGGMGLTGVITSATIQLRRTASAYVDVLYRRTRNLDETLDGFAQTDGQCRYSVAWIDCLARGISLGRSVLMLANDVDPAQLPARLQAAPLQLPTSRKKSFPRLAPNGLLNPLTVKAFNACYYARHRDGQRIVDYGRFFYPLDGVEKWNRVYGRRGFVQYQVLLPPATSRAGLIRLLEEISGSRQASFLAVLKSCGDAGQGLLSFPYRGHTLALDFPHTGEPLRALLTTLDEITLAHGGRLYLAKDAMTTPAAFAQMYPRLAEFQRIKKQIDPHCRFASCQARRLGIVAPAANSIVQPQRSAA